MYPPSGQLGAGAKTMGLALTNVFGEYGTRSCLRLGTRDFARKDETGTAVFARQNFCSVCVCDSVTRCLFAFSALDLAASDVILGRCSRARDSFYAVSRRDAVGALHDRTLTCSLQRAEPKEED